MSGIGDQEELALGKVYESDLVRRLWPFARPHWRYIMFSFLLIPLRGLLEVVPPLVVGAALNYLVEGEVSSPVPLAEGFLQPHLGLGPLEWLFAVLITVAVALLSLDWLRGWSMLVLGQKTVLDLRRHLFDHVQRLPMRFFDRYPVGRLVTRLTNDLESLAEMFSMGVVALIADLFVMAFFALSTISAGVLIMALTIFAI